ncbi:ATP-binding protein [Actinomadura graeca]|uniref:ATP-binding protein n=1 Tax=Actinomadura graeca TaxID=2750812 RepID=A0ABX8QXU4_9ACTN|nr:ATP-binding protein [Actinomadura graeca]QXJ23626.1 ATP-binding protein [Actinomadura graeca]
MIDVTRWSRLFAGQPQSIGDARAFARALVVDRAPDDLVRTVELVVSELCTNAVEHTASGEDGGEFVLELEVQCGHVRVGVLDMGAQTRPAVSDQASGSDVISGRGLFIVEAVSKAWGSEPIRVGRRVWADVVGMPV